MSDTDSLTSTLSLGIDENDNRSVNLSNDVRRRQGVDWLDFDQSDSELEDFKADEKILGEGSDEDDALLVIFHD